MKRHIYLGNLKKLNQLCIFKDWKPGTKEYNTQKLITPSYLNREILSNLKHTLDSLAPQETAIFDSLAHTSGTICKKYIKDIILGSFVRYALQIKISYDPLTSRDIFYLNIKKELVKEKVFYSKDILSSSKIIENEEDTINWFFDKLELFSSSLNEINYAEFMNEANKLDNSWGVVVVDKNGRDIHGKISFIQMIAKNLHEHPVFNMEYTIDYFCDSLPIGYLESTVLNFANGYKKEGDTLGGNLLLLLEIKEFLSMIIDPEDNYEVSSIICKYFPTKFPLMYCIINEYFINMKAYTYDSIKRILLKNS